MTSLYPPGMCIRHRARPNSGRLGSLLCMLFALALPPQMADADEVHVAVAANFLATLREIGEEFRRQQGHSLVISSGSTGKLYAQITHGAPYEIFLAADAERPQRLEKETYAVMGSRFTYARGRLALWSRDPARVDAGGQILATGKFHHLAMANARTAPYGVAAKETLVHLGLWETLAPNIVQGEDIGQVLQFVESGSAEVGFIAFAQAKKRATGSYWLVPQEYHAPLIQQAVLLRRGSKHAAARAFMDFLRGPVARRIIQGDGYDVP